MTILFYITAKVEVYMVSDEHKYMVSNILILHKRIHVYVTFTTELHNAGEGHILPYGIGHAQNGIITR